MPKINGLSFSTDREIQNLKPQETKVKRLPESDKVARFYVFNANVMMNFDIEAKSGIKQSNSSNFSNIFEK